MTAEPTVRLDGPSTHERHIPLEGAVNFRDLGGYETTDGRRVRWRTLFRADGLSSLTAQDRGVIRQLGVATVIDLRTSLELIAGRFPVDEIPVDFHHFPLLDKVPDPGSFKVTPGLLASQYQEMAREAAGQIGAVLTLLATQETHPVIIHCAAGKDRTGVMVAVLLDLLGIPDETIVADYALSARAMAALRLRLAERYPDAQDAIAQADELFSAAPANIEALLADLRAGFGSIEGYARAAGAGPEVVAGLRQHLLDQSAGT
jgi:protein-tyrosine phosphatase